MRKAILERNGTIINAFDTMRKDGYAAQHCMETLGKQYFLSARTIRDIVYDRALYMKVREQNSVKHDSNSR